MNANGKRTRTSTKTMSKDEVTNIFTSNDLTNWCFNHVERIDNEVTCKMCREPIDLKAKTTNVRSIISHLWNEHSVDKNTEKRFLASDDEDEEESDDFDGYFFPRINDPEAVRMQRNGNKQPVTQEQQDNLDFRLLKMILNFRRPAKETLYSPAFNELLNFGETDYRMPDHNEFREMVRSYLKGECVKRKIPK